MDFDYVVMPTILFVVSAGVIWLSARRVLSLSKDSSHAWRKFVERIALEAVVCIAAVLAGSSAFNAIAIWQYRAANPPPGAFYSVNGHQMHINCTGSGSPTIVLEAGAANDATVWETVQPALSRTTRVCSYDRAGYGWSEPQPGPSDADHIAAQLHELLIQANVNGPIVLMGHSIAGLYMRDYAAHYPEGLAGMVFLDVSTPLMEENPAYKAVNPNAALRWAVWQIYRSALAAGLPRLLWICHQPVPFLNNHATRMQAENLFHSHIGTVVSEQNSFSNSGRQTVHTGPFGDLPILIFSQDFAPWISGSNPSKEWVEVAKMFMRMQEDLKKLSTRSRRIIAKGSGHSIQYDRADLIEKEVPVFIEQIRGTAPQPANYGSTVTE
jgi:pimeloyl-ACP methyl ester carboxylesterase